MENLKKQHIRRVGFENGPFMIVVTELVESKDESPFYPILVGPSDSDPFFKTVEEAEGWIMRNYANRKQPFLGLVFTIAPFRSCQSFHGFCSLEE